MAGIAIKKKSFLSCKKISVKNQNSEELKCDTMSQTGGVASSSKDPGSPPTKTRQDSRHLGEEDKQSHD